MAKPLRLPTVGDDGSLYGHVGRYAGMAVVTAFEMIGGTDRLAAWADKNPGEFFTKVLPKTIAKPHEHTVSEGVEDLLDKLDRVERQQRLDTSHAVDAEFTESENDA